MQTHNCFVFAIFVSFFWACAYSMATITESLHWGYFSHPFLSRNFTQNFFLSLCWAISIRFHQDFSFSFTRTIFLSLHWATLAIHFCREFFFIHSEFFSFSPLGYFHPFSSRIFFSFTRKFFLSLHWATSIHFHPEFFFIHTDNFFTSLHWAISAIRFCSRTFFHSHGQFFFLSIRLF